jgi:hypothetical protein
MIELRGRPRSGERSYGLASFNYLKDLLDTAQAISL